MFGHGWREQSSGAQLTHRGGHGGIGRLLVVGLLVAVVAKAFAAHRTSGGGGRPWHA